MEVFMDDFSVFGYSFHDSLINLDLMLVRVRRDLLGLKLGKCHFMVTERILLGHKVSKAGIKVERIKIDIISRLPPPTNVKGV